MPRTLLNSRDKTRDKGTVSAHKELTGNPRREPGPRCASWARGADPPGLQRCPRNRGAAETWRRRFSWDGEQSGLDVVTTSNSFPSPAVQEEGVQKPGSERLQPGLCICPSARLNRFV